MRKTALFTLFASPFVLAGCSGGPKSSVQAQAAPASINAANINYTTGQISISGSGFGTAVPTVKLDTLFPTVVASSDTNVTIGLPANLTPSSYALRVTNNMTNSVADFILTLGAVGPQSTGAFPITTFSPVQTQPGSTPFWCFATGNDCYGNSGAPAAIPGGTYRTWTLTFTAPLPSTQGYSRIHLCDDLGALSCQNTSVGPSVIFCDVQPGGKSCTTTFPPTALSAAASYAVKVDLHGLLPYQNFTAGGSWVLQ